MRPSSYRLLAANKVTLESMIRYDPRLGTLIEEAAAQVDPLTPTYCRERVFNVYFMPRIKALIGTGGVSLRRHGAKWLGNHVDLVSEVIRNFLPACRGCEHDFKRGRQCASKKTDFIYR